MATGNRKTNGKRSAKERNVTPINSAWTPEELAQIARDEMDNETFSARLIEQIQSAPALLTKNEIFRIEESLRLDAWRRAALLILTASGAELIERVAKHRHFAITCAGIYAELSAVEDRYKGLYELVGSVKPRLMVAMAGRTDMSEVIQAGRESLSE